MFFFSILLKTSAPIEAWEGKLEIMTYQPEPTNRKANIMGSLPIIRIIRTLVQCSVTPGKFVCVVTQLMLKDLLMHSLKFNFFMQIIRFLFH